MTADVRRRLTELRDEMDTESAAYENVAHAAQGCDYPTCLMRAQTLRECSSKLDALVRQIPQEPASEPLELPLPHKTFAEMRRQYDAMSQAILDAEIEANEAGYPEGEYLARVIRSLRDARESVAALDGRIVALAREHQREIHHVAMDEQNNLGIRRGHTAPFDSCIDKDCVLVRTLDVKGENK